MSSAYKVIFFDLDHTLWDYDRNAEATLTELFQTHLPESSNSLEELIATFKVYNEQVWQEYHRGDIPQSFIQLKRFEHFLEHYNWHSQELSLSLSRKYMEIGPTQPHLFPEVPEVLNYLKQNYPLAIITNGFESSQHRKVKHSGIQNYFDYVITSEKVGIKKPDAGIFDYALELYDLGKEEALMIGDNENTDISGATNAGIDSILFDPDRVMNPTSAKHRISSLSELYELL